jgi:hypothetical protein
MAFQNWSAVFPQGGSLQGHVDDHINMVHRAFIRGYRESMHKFAGLRALYSSLGFRVGLSEVGCQKCLRLRGVVSVRVLLPVLS